MKKFYLPVILMLVFLINVRSNVIYVKSDAAGANNGETWGNAFTNLKTAIDASTMGDTIYVAKGTYKPHASSRNTYFEITQDLKIYGGFVGNETNINSSTLENRDFIANETTLSGDLSGDDGNDFSNMDDNSYHVVRFDSDGTDISENACIDGFTITGGNANGGSWHGMTGGGVLISAYIYDTCNPQLNNLIIKNNSSGIEGGGIGILIGGSGSSCSPTINNTKVLNNEASQVGGGIAAIAIIDGVSINPTFNNVTIAYNEAYKYGGGAYHEASCGAKINAVYKDAAFANNYTTMDGNAIYNVTKTSLGSCSKADSSKLNVSITNSTINIAADAINNREAYGKITTNITNTIIEGLISGWSLPVINQDDAETNFTNCIIANSGGSGAKWDTLVGNDLGNNMDTTAWLVFSDSLDFRLYAGSPALGNGDVTNGNNIGYYQGSAVTYPTITFTPETFNFGGVSIDDSLTLSSVLNGSNLQYDVKVRKPMSGFFTISENENTGFGTDDIMVKQNSGSISSKSIYIKYKPKSTYGDTSQVKVYLNNNFYLEYPVIFSGLSSINEKTRNTAAIGIMPNPATDEITIIQKSDIPITAKIEILDINGKLLQQANMFKQNLTLNIEELPKGMYFINISSKEYSEIIKMVKL